MNTHDRPHVLMSLGQLGRAFRVINTCAHSNDSHASILCALDDFFPISIKLKKIYMAVDVDVFHFIYLKLFSSKKWSLRHFSIFDQINNLLCSFWQNRQKHSAD